MQTLFSPPTTTLAKCMGRGAPPLYSSPSAPGRKRGGRERERERERERWACTFDVRGGGKRKERRRRRNKLMYLQVSMAGEIGRQHEEEEEEGRRGGELLS